MATENIIDLTENAKKQIQNIIDQNPGKILKVGVASGGCSGFTYEMNLISESEILEDDLLIEDDKIQVVVDGMSLMFLVGSELDYATELMGSRFVWLNPQEANGCGCGTSFSV